MTTWLCIAHEMQYQRSLRLRAIVLPIARSSLYRDESTSDLYRVDFFALSRGTWAPHEEHCTLLDMPFRPLPLPLLRLFFGIYNSSMRLIRYDGMPS